MEPGIAASICAPVRSEHCDVAAVARTSAVEKHPPG
jgi:hypothetical protein